MGDRVSIQFAKGKEKSVVLFNHWGGMDFVYEAEEYARELMTRAREKGQMMPLYRLEPGTVMVDFISHYTGGKTIESNLYLGRTSNDGDNSDNGHFVIELTLKGPVPGPGNRRAPADFVRQE
jgi:hypothetical protein